MKPSEFEGYRSVIYVPAHSGKMLAKAANLGADAVVLDLEDGVHPDAKREARTRLASWLDAYGRHDANRRLWVRVNGRSTAWGAEDLDMVASRLAVVVIPKAETVEDLRWALARQPRLTLFLMIETAGGVLDAPRLARSDSVCGLVFGAADYRASMMVASQHDEREIAYARHRIIHAAKASGIVSVDCPWFDTSDEIGLVASALRAREMGFDAKSAIHPNQLPKIHQVFSPSEEEVSWALDVIRHLDEAAQLGQAVCLLNGSLIEAPHRAIAQRILARVALNRGNE